MSVAEVTVPLRATRPKTLPAKSSGDLVVARRRAPSFDAGIILSKPFKTPKVSMQTRETPQRKRRKVNYKEEDGGSEKDDTKIAPRTPLTPVATINRFPVFEPKDKSVAFKQKFKVPMIKPSDSTFDRPPPALGMLRRTNVIARPLHDPSGEFAIVLYDPTIDDLEVVAANEAAKEAAMAELPKTVSRVHKSLAEMLGLNKKKEEKPKVAVVIDPRLAKVLRPHQVEGVKFLYRCTTGLINPIAHGCIMADEMGLGKTLQCIALLWTLLRQSPEAGKPTIEKCIIVCPSSLVKNWANELIKWLGKDALTPFAIDGKASKAELTRQLRQWAIAEGKLAAVRPVLIVSYETLRINVSELKDMQIGLMLCDEGHRLKNNDSLTFQALNSLNVQRRVILSGTPIQNDLSEYFSLLNFANPGLLGSRAEFRKNYEIPILRGRDADGTEADRGQGDAKLAELGTLVNKFIIRRTNDILSKYLPVKYEHVVFCRLSQFQENLYRYALGSSSVNKLLRGDNLQPLKAIDMLKKICNHPDLLNLPEDLEGCEQHFPEDYVPKGARASRDQEVDASLSGKMLVLERMLAMIRRETNDKIVLISNYTQTLDVIERYCRSKRYELLRLDGTMAVTKRQKLVDQFNDPEAPAFVFLLSSKAGGCGINLIGANRLILFDPDWNPAADQQALARVWRDGQKKDCFVYRFIATGTIEEKIFQRQSHKQSLSSCVVDEVQDVERHFSFNNLRQLFQYDPNAICETHTKFKCKRCKADGRQFVKSPAMLYGDSNSWNHFTNDQLSTIQDLLLRNEAGRGQVSYAFQYISH